MDALQSRKDISMSHFLNRSKVSHPAQPVADCVHSAMTVQRDLIARSQAQMHASRPRVLKPPTG